MSDEQKAVSNEDPISIRLMKWAGSRKNTLVSANWNEYNELLALVWSSDVKDKEIAELKAKNDYLSQRYLHFSNVYIDQCFKAEENAATIKALEDKIEYLSTLHNQQVIDIARLMSEKNK